MKLNPTEQCLSLVLQTLETDISPEVKSDSGRRAVQILSATLSDVLKRHQNPSLELLRSCIDSGRLLEAEIEHRIKLSDGECTLVPDKASFEDLANIYSQMTDRIHNLCKKLSLSRSKIPDAGALLRRAAQWEAEYPLEQSKLPAKLFAKDAPATKELTTSSTPPVKEVVDEYLKSIHGPLELTQFKEVVGGFGKETYFADLTYPSGTVEEIVIRKSQAVPVITHRGFLLEREFSILRSLSKTGYLAPVPIDLAYNSPGGTFYTMNRLPGKVLASSFLDEKKMEFAEHTIVQLAELLAQLHSIPLGSFRDFFEEQDELEALNETIEDSYRRNLKGWREYVNRVEHLPSPYIVWLFDWLENNIPDDKRPAVLTHGDFSVHNILAENGKITGVLDWESAEFGAPEQDIAYIQPFIAEYVDWDKFLGYYYAAGGQAIKPKNMTFCLAFGVLRFFVAGTRASFNLQTGANRDIRYIMMELGIANKFMEIGLKYAKDAEAAAAEKQHSFKTPAIVNTTPLPSAFGTAAT